MTRTRQIIVGLGVLIAGLVALAVGELVGSNDLVVGLVLLLILPQAVSFGGAVVALIGLARHPTAPSGASPIPRIIGGVALAGVGVACGYTALATLSQLPDYAAGLNGVYAPPTFLAMILFPAVGLAVGLAIGGLVAFLWWVAEGRRARSEAVAARPR